MRERWQRIVDRLPVGPKTQVWLLRYGEWLLGGAVVLPVALLLVGLPLFGVDQSPVQQTDLHRVTVLAVDATHSETHGFRTRVFFKTPDGHMRSVTTGSAAVAHQVVNDACVSRTLRASGRDQWHLLPSEKCAHLATARP